MASQGSADSTDGSKDTQSTSKSKARSLSELLVHRTYLGRRIRELTSVVRKRFKFPKNNVELYAEKVNNRGMCAIAQAESLRYKLLGGLAVQRACYGVLRFVMENGAKGCEWKTLCPTCQVHEIQGWVHDLLRATRQGVH